MASVIRGRPDEDPQDDSSFASLIDAARAGSQEALGELLQRCRGQLLKLATRSLSPHVRSKEGASDVFQQTSLDAQQDFGRFVGQTPQEFVVWLRQILLHNLTNTHRRYQQTAKRDIGCEAIPVMASRTSRQFHAVSPDPSPSTCAMADESREQVQRALLRIPEDYRRVIVLRNRDGLPFAEIGTSMGRSEATVRKLWTRAIKQFRRALEEERAG
jgi:RNA polymerase sigma-70 factor (ECF subfamily)